MFYFKVYLPVKTSIAVRELLPWSLATDKGVLIVLLSLLPGELFVKIKLPSY